MVGIRKTLCFKERGKEKQSGSVLCGVCAIRERGERGAGGPREVENEFRTPEEQRLRTADGGGG